MRFRTIVIGLVLGILAVVGFYVWTVQRWENTKTEQFLPKDESGVLPGQDTDIEERQKFASEMRKHLLNEEYDSLEKFSQEMINTKARFAGGDWKLLRFYQALSEPEKGDAAPEDQWKLVLSKLEKWTEQYPDSVFANVILGDAQIGYAWKARGTDFADKVTSEQWKLYTDRMTMAEQTLTKKYDQRRSCVAWFTVMQSIGVGTGWDIQRMSQLLEEGTSIEPLFHELYYIHCQYLMPRWHGSPGDWERFINDASAKLGGIEGSILYAETCWRISRYYPGEEFFKQNDVDWQRIKQGFMDREKIYGKSFRYLNAFSILACQRFDRPTARALFIRIGEHREPFYWPDKNNFNYWRRWANSGG